MLSFKEYLKRERSKKSIVFTFGRFQGLTTGHEKLINTVIREAKETDSIPLIYTSQRQDRKKNPLSYDFKITILRKLFPEAVIPREINIKTPFDVLKNLSDRGYKNVTMIVGDDRYEEFKEKVKTLVDKGTYLFYNINIKNAGERKSEESGTDMRNFALNDNFDKFRQWLPSVADDQTARIIFEEIKENL
jgi:hypothetical protein